SQSPNHRGRTHCNLSGFMCGIVDLELVSESTKTTPSLRFNRGNPGYETRALSRSQEPKTAPADGDSRTDACRRTRRPRPTQSIADDRRIGGVPAITPATALRNYIRVTSSAGLFAKFAGHASGKRRFHEARVEQRRAHHTGRRTNSRRE